MTWRRWLSLTTVSLAAVLSARPAAAQLAPTGGHYATQPSDTGFAGGVSSSGSYSTSVPLDVPGARNGLPVPVSIVYGGGGVGAAGLGWDVPLSYIVHDTTVAHRRPTPTPGGGWQPREAITLVLDGRAIDLVVTAPGSYVARRDAPQHRPLGQALVLDSDGGGAARRPKSAVRFRRHSPGTSFDVVGGRYRALLDLGSDRMRMETTARLRNLHKSDDIY